MAIQTLTLNVNAQPSAEDRAFLYLSQNENGRDIRFRVLGDDLPSGCTATLSGVKPDGNVWSKAGTVTNNFVVVEEDIQMTAVAGRWDAQLDIVNGSKNIVTALIRITVEAAAVEAGAVPSDTQLEGYVEQCKQYAETAKNEAYGSPLTAATAAAMTDQSRVYVYTGSETGYTAGHWYYYNGTVWTDGGVYNAVAVDTDTTLSVSGKAADAKKTGDQVSAIKEDLSDVDDRVTALEQGGSGLTAEAKAALLACFAHVAWVDSNGQTYYNALDTALNPPQNLSSITAVYTQSGTVYTTDSLDDLKSDLVVTAHYSDNTTAVVSSYTLSGTLTAGTSTITVSYGGKSTTFTVTVTEAPTPVVETKWIDGMGATAKTSAGNYAPFFLPAETYAYDYSKKISAIELNIKTAGTISVGYKAASDVVVGEVYDSTGDTIAQTFTVTETGEQKLTLSEPLTLPSGSILFIQSNSETAKFYYGGTLSNGFIFVNSNDSNKLTAQSYKLGVNVYVV